MKAWLPTVSIAVAAFIFVTSEFLPVGLLSDIALDFHQTESETGLVMTIYAWLVALLSIPLTTYAARFDRRPLLLSLLAVFVGAHALTVFAWTFNALVFARFFVAVAHAVFWAISIPLGIRVAPAGQRERAMSVVATGATLGSVLGIPLGTLLGQLFGWRMGFGAIGLFAAALYLILFCVLPRAPSLSAGDFKLVVDLFRRRKLVLVYVLTVVMMTGQFSAFTFVSPYLQHVGGLRPDLIASVLFAYGGAGFLASFVVPRFLKHHLKASALAGIAVVALCLFALKLAVGAYPSTLALAFVWGFALLFVNLVLQSFVLTIAADAEDVAMAGFSGIYNVGIGGGALAGSLLAQNHLELVGYEAGALAMVALALNVWYFAPARPPVET